MPDIVIFGQDSERERVWVPEADMQPALLWPRLHFGDGGTLDLRQPVDEWQRPSFEERWRAVSVRVEWLRSHRGRLDRALEIIVTPAVDNPTD